MRRKVAIVFGSVAALLLSGTTAWATGTGIRQGVAFVAMTNELETMQDAAARYAPAAASLSESGKASAAAVQLAEELAAAAADVYVPQDARTELVAAADGLGLLLDELVAHQPDFAPIRVDSYTTEALEAVTAGAEERIAWYGERAGTAAGLEDRLGEQTEAVRAAARTLFDATAQLALTLDADNWVATVDRRLEYRRSVDALDGAVLDRAGVDALARYVEAAAALEASNEAELESFAGPLSERRLAAQEFANSIAGGVFLDFDWVPELFGFGSANGGMAGQASLESEGEYFFSRITLTDSVAERWGDGRAESIVAHEVGHAITLKCIDIFTAHAGGDYEAFATAWAIGMGFDTPSNGQAAYGRPSEELIAATMDCR